MTEKFEDQEGNSEVLFTRHSPAKYATYKDIIRGDNPHAPVDRDGQLPDDLTEKGIQLAKESAEALLATLRPDSDELFFASSDEMRALETANIYRSVAHEKGFIIIKPENVRGSTAEEIGEGEIRTVRSLSLGIKDTLLGSIFNPDAHLGEINWDKVEPEVKEKWAQARAIINEDDQGSWGGNFAVHSKAIKEIFPEIKDSEQTYETQFKNLLRLSEFALKKAEESGNQKNIKILAFGHENYWTHALDVYFHDHKLNNCETIRIKPSDENLVLQRRGETQAVNPS